MPGSDVLALDPLAATGDATQRLIARVAELETRLERVASQIPSTVQPLPSRPNVTTWGASSVNDLVVSYTAKGGYILLIGGANILVGQNSVPQYGGSCTLYVNGSSVDVATTQTGFDGSEMGNAVPVRPLIASVGTAPAGTIYSFQMSATGLAQRANFSEFRLAAVELPYAG